MRERAFIQRIVNQKSKIMTNSFGRSNNFATLSQIYTLYINRPGRCLRRVRMLGRVPGEAFRASLNRWGEGETLPVFVPVRLIEDGKVLLAIDPDQPTRILTTDKKAQKAGGLCLALKGVPVKPTDDVDVDKEYQLIPLDSL